MRLFLVLCFAGAISNITDILQHGYVVNFLRFEVINVPIINLADVYIICGALSLIIITFLPNKKDVKV
jgi:signal peptidase II